MRVCPLWRRLHDHQSETPVNSPQPNPSGPATSAQAWWTLAAVCVTTFASGLTATALNVALPSVARHFEASALQASLILIGFHSTTTMLLLFFGRIADLRGRRETFLIGLAVFTLASLALGWAPNVEVLIGLRVIQAIGAAMLLTNCAALINDTFSRERVGQGMGIYLASYSISSLIGPIVGGFITESWGWQWLFWINVPLGLGCWILAAKAIPTDAGRTHPDASLDVCGNALSVVAIATLLWGIAQVSVYGWLSARVAVFVAIGIVCTAAFVMWERRHPQPVLEFALFAHRGFSAGVTGAFIHGVCRFAPALTLPIYYQSVREMGPVDASIMIMPFVICTIVGSLLYSVIAPHVSARTVTRWSGAVSTAGLALLMVSVNPDGSQVLLMTGQVLIGLGGGAFLPASTTSTLEAVEDRHVGLANAARLVMLNVGASAGTALAASLLVSTVPASLAAAVIDGTLMSVAPEALPDALNGFELAYAVFTIGSLIGTAIAWWDRPEQPVRQSAA